jgi:hypothetical protein
MLIRPTTAPIKQAVRTPYKQYQEGAGECPALLNFYVWGSPLRPSFGPKASARAAEDLALGPLPQWHSARMTVLSAIYTALPERPPERASSIRSHKTLTIQRPYCVPAASHCRGLLEDHASLHQCGQSKTRYRMFADGLSEGSHAICPSE